MPKIHRWTDDDRSIIRRYFTHTLKSRQDIAAMLGVTEAAVGGQIASMGIAKSDDRRQWTQKEKKRLAFLSPKFCVRAIARKMHRSLNSVVVMSSRMHISRRAHEGWFTKKEVSEILGHDHKWIQARIDDGRLVATWHYETLPVKSGQSAWHIEQPDLILFIRKYPQDLVGCNIDIIMIVELLAGVIPWKELIGDES